MLRILSSLLFLIIVNGLYAKNPVKVEKKLNKLYNQNKIEKLEKKAVKLSSKNKSLDCSYYFLSKIELEKSDNISPKPHIDQWKHLHKSIKYSTKLTNDKYKNWQDTVANAINDYLNLWSNNENKHIESAKKEYKKYLSEISQAVNTSPTIVTDNKLPESTENKKSIREIIIETAEEQVGNKYKYGGELPETGFDCSGFVKYVYGKVGIELPHNSHMQSQLSGQTLTINEAIPGDLIFFGTKHSKGWRTQHAGIVYGFNNNGILVIHSSSRGVIIDGDNASWDSYWKKRILFVKRIPELSD